MDSGIVKNSYMMLCHDQSACPLFDGSSIRNEGWGVIKPSSRVHTGQHCTLKYFSYIICFTMG